MNYRVIFQSVASAVGRQVYFYMVDATDGFTPETGVVFIAGDILVSQSGAAEVNHAGTVAEIAGGLYVYEATVGEVGVLGVTTFRFTKAGVARTYLAITQVVDPNNLGMAYLDAAVSTRATPAQILSIPANPLLTDLGGRVTLVPTQEDAIVDKVWDELQAGHVVAGSFGKRLDADMSTRAVPGSAMTLTSGERDAVANALLNLADGVELGFTPKQALRLIAAVLCGKTSGGPTNVIFRNMGDTANRVVTIADGNGNRTTVTLLP